MCVGLVTHFAQIWLVRRVDVHVFLSVAAVCKPSVAAFKLTLERLLSCKEKIKEEYISSDIYFLNCCCIKTPWAECVKETVQCVRKIQNVKVVFTV